MKHVWRRVLACLLGFEVAAKVHSAIDVLFGGNDSDHHGANRSPRIYVDPGRRVDDAKIGASERDGKEVPKDTSIKQVDIVRGKTNIDFGRDHITRLHIACRGDVFNH